MSFGPSVKETALEKLIELLNQITVQNGYNNDVKKVYDELPSYEDMVSFPCIALETDLQHYKNVDSGGHTTQLFEKKWRIRIWIFMYDNANNMQKQSLKMEQDVEHCLFSTFLRRSLNGSCQDIMIADSDNFGTTVEKPRYGVWMDLDIHFTQAMSDTTKRR